MTTAPGHPTKAGAGYDCACGECQHRSVTAGAELCGHRWWLLTHGNGAYTGALEGCDGYPLSTHRCVENTANHGRGHLCGCGATTPVRPHCGHRWSTRSPIGDFTDGHDCTESAGHADPCPCPDGTCTVICAQPPVHKCRCGATTERIDHA